jgi:hypothetical protein
VAAAGPNLARRVNPASMDIQTARKIPRTGTVDEFGLA